MGTAVALVGFASFLGGLFVISRTVDWVALLISSLRSSRERGRSKFVFVPLVFHSCPWTLMLAAGAMYYVSQSAERAYLVAAIAGFGISVALVVGASLVAVLRHRHPKSEPPLTQERLRAIRRRFYWGNSLFFAIALSAGAFFLYGFMLSEARGFAVLFFMAGFLVGWLWAWFMWQWYGAALEVRERRRRQREARDAI